MIKSDKQYASFAELLSKEDAILVSQTIDSLRDAEPFEGAIGLLASLYDRSNDTLVKKAVELFLNDVKDPSSRNEVMNEIKKTWKNSTKTMLVSSCWQSGQDYSEFTEDFASIFREADFATAVECYTVIMEAMESISREKKDNIIKIIEVISPSDEKSALASDLISILG